MRGVCMLWVGAVVGAAAAGFACSSMARAAAAAAAASRQRLFSPCRRHNHWRGTVAVAAASPFAGRARRGARLVEATVIPEEGRGRSAADTDTDPIAGRPAGNAAPMRMFWVRMVMVVIREGN